MRDRLWDPHLALAEAVLAAAIEAGAILVAYIIAGVTYGLSGSAR